MKNIFKFLSLFFVLGLFLACTKQDDAVIAEPEIVIQEKTTVVYVVRHAERGTNDPVDPDLSSAGQTRALALKDSLSKTVLSAIYSTDYKRTKQTAAPTAQVKGLTPAIYQGTAAGLTALATKVKAEHVNQTVLIVGHSDTVLETIEAFGIQRPIASLSSSDYNYLFKITLKENKTPVVEVKRYGL